MVNLTDRVLARGELTIYARAPPKDKKLEDPDYFIGGWKEIRKEHNLITNVGWETYANTLTNTGSYINKHYTYFAWGDGTTSPAITDTAATFYADCLHSDTKAVTTIQAFVVATLTQEWDCFLSVADNAVTSISKFAMMDASPGTNMFNEIKFSPITKNASVEFYFKYKLSFSQV